MSDMSEDQNLDIRQLAEFFDAHSTADLPGEDVEVEPAREPMVSRSIRIEYKTMLMIRKIATDRHVGVTQLMRQWILERLAQELRKPTVVSVTEVVSPNPRQPAKIARPAAAQGSRRTQAQGRIALPAGTSIHASPKKATVGTKIIGYYLSESRKRSGWKR
jgi:hypothetical protein